MLNITKEQKLVNTKGTSSTKFHHSTIAQFILFTHMYIADTF